MAEKNERKRVVVSFPWDTHPLGESTTKCPCCGEENAVHGMEESHTCSNSECNKEFDVEPELKHFPLV
ncbi:hypothetical protein K9M59_02790 [Candidatus Gracilibacteria bacterium]|nr:hypothetical protein [Candidatus Gracilibacteria bacterium]MCF7819258.1 hypothetical protein [Candidatus Gracilibacteria bacterium]